MSYDYRAERGYVFTEQGHVQFLRIRDRIKGLLRQAGAVSMGCAIRGETGSSWEMMACVDRVVELGEIRELTDARAAGQHRVFVEVPRD